MGFRWPRGWSPDHACRRPGQGLRSICRGREDAKSGSAIFVPLVVTSAVPHEHPGVATSQVQFWRSLGQRVGVTVLGAVLASQIGASIGDPESVVTATNVVGHVALETGLRYVFLVAAVATALGAVIALLLKEVPMRGRAARIESVPVIAEPATIAD